LLVSITTAIGFILGSFTTDIFPEKAIELKINIEKLFNTQLNKYYIIVILHSIILIVNFFSTIIFESKTNRMQFIENKIAQNKNHFEMNNEEVIEEYETHKKLDNKNEEAYLNQEGLILYNEVIEHSPKLENQNKSFDSRELNFIMEKDEFMHGHSFNESVRKVKSDVVFNNTEENIEIEIQTQHKNVAIGKDIKIKSFQHQNSKDKENYINYDDLQRNYTLIEYNYNMITENNVGNSLIKSESEIERNNTNQIEITQKTEENLQIQLESNNEVKSIMKKLSDKQIRKNDKIHSEGIICINNEKNNNTHENKLREKHPEFTLLTTIIEIPKAVLFILFLFILFDPTGLVLEPSNIALILGFNTLFSELFIFLFSKFYKLKGLNFKRIIYLNVIIYQISFCMLITPFVIPLVFINSIKLILTFFFFAISMSSLENCLSCIYLNSTNLEKMQSNKIEITKNKWVINLLRFLIVLGTSLSCSYLIFGRSKVFLSLICVLILLPGFITMYLVKKFSNKF